MRLESSADSADVRFVSFSRLSGLVPIHSPAIVARWPFISGNRRCSQYEDVHHTRKQFECQGPRDRWKSGKDNVKQLFCSLFWVTKSRDNWFVALDWKSIDSGQTDDAFSRCTWRSLVVSCWLPTLFHQPPIGGPPYKKWLELFFLSQISIYNRIETQ
jgi:hypothetical protein